MKTQEFLAQKKTQEQKYIDLCTKIISDYDFENLNKHFNVRIKEDGIILELYNIEVEFIDNSPYRIGSSKFKVSRPFFKVIITDTNIDFRIVTESYYSSDKEGVLSANDIVKLGEIAKLIEDEVKR